MFQNKSTFPYRATLSKYEGVNTWSNVATPFSYSIFQNKSIRQYDPISGVHMISYSFVIETPDQLDYNKGDRILVGSKTYSIESVEIVPLNEHALSTFRTNGLEIYRLTLGG